MPTYTVTSPIKFHGKRREIGAPVTINDRKVAAALLASGAIAAGVTEDDEERTRREEEEARKRAEEEQRRAEQVSTQQSGTTQAGAIDPATAQGTRGAGAGDADQVNTAASSDKKKGKK